MQRHPLSHANTNSGDLVLATFAFFRPADPNANAVLAPFGAHVEGGKRVYDPIFEGCDEAADIGAAPLEIKHQVNNPLAGAVIGQLASAAALVDRKTRLDHVRRVRAGASSVERGVLHEPDELRRASCGDLRRTRLHDGHLLIIGDDGMAHPPFSSLRPGRYRKAD